MNAKVFSWQKKDFDTLYESSNRTTIVCGKDIDSPYNIFFLFTQQVLQTKFKIFNIKKCDPFILAPLYPFMETISYGTSRPVIHNDLIKGIVRDITQSDTLATVISGLLHRKPKSTPMLDGQSNDILIQLQKQTRNIPALFIFQNFSYFDTLSIELIRLMISGNLNETYRFLESARFYFLRSENENNAAYQIIEMYEHGNIYLKSPTKENMNELVSEITPSINLSHNDQLELFTICGGSMVAIQILLQYLRDTQREHLITWKQDNIIAEIIQKRIADIGINYMSLEKTLKIAASIGDPFSLQLLKWVVELPDEIFENNLLKSKNELFIDFDESIGSFTYPVIREYFQVFRDLREKSKIFDTIARGIYFYNPRDYWRRAVFLELADKKREACEVYFIAFYSLNFDTHVRSEEYKKKISSLCRECDLEDFWIIQMQFYNWYENMEYEKAWKCLDSFDKPLSGRLYLLKEYLIIMCIRKCGESRQLQEIAQMTLETAAKNAKDIEEGLWCDYLSTLISLYVNLDGNIQKASAIEKELRFYYTSKLDRIFAEIGINILNRKSAAIFSVERAVTYTQMSVNYFKNSIYSTQYLMALNNHGANLLLLGKYADAEEYLLEALEFTKKYPTNEIIIIYLLNNYCVCQIHKPSGNYAALADLQIIVNRYKHYGWSIIPLINCAIYAALNNNLDKAEDLLNEAYKLNGNVQDSYFFYYIDANLAAVHYLRGDRIGASKLLIEKCSVPPVLSKATEQQYLKQRTVKWAKAMLDFAITDPWDFQNLLIHEESGNQWIFVGRGFLCSDIQFWSEA
jgi:tetratricopeptide (TPR) repeat protein